MKEPLSFGHKLFFLLSALSAIFFPMYLVTVMINDYPFPGALLDVVSWHGHEMLFGFLSAFLTSILIALYVEKGDVKNGSLILLGLFWLITRLIFWFQPSQILLYIFSPICLVLLIKIMIRAMKKSSLRIFIIFLLLLQIASSFLFLYSYFNGAIIYKEISLNLIQCSVFLFLFHLSGILIPQYSYNRLNIAIKRTSNQSDFATISLSVIFFISQLLNIESFFFNCTIVIFIIFLLIYRSFKMFQDQHVKDSLITSMHIAHFSLVFYFPLYLLDLHYDNWTIGRPGIHALFAGAFSLFGFSLINRLSLIHSSFEYKSSKLVSISLLCIFIGAIGRVFIPVLSNDLYDKFLHISMGFWTLAFIFFVIKFLPKFVKS